MRYQSAHTIIYYPISLKKIKEKVAKKKVTKPTIEQLLDFNDLQNINETTKEFGESLVRVGGEIPVDLSLKDGQRFLFVSTLPYHFLSN